MLYKPNSHYRPASSASAVREDDMCINAEAGLFAVYDGVSEPYSPSNPKIMYGKLTGGQMVGATIGHILENAGVIKSIEGILSEANSLVYVRHQYADKHPKSDAVAGACVAACQIEKDFVRLVLVGDCFVFWRNDQGVHSLTNFDQAACDFEKKGDAVFQQCLDAVDAKFPETRGKNIGKAWDEYFPYFSQQQHFRANRNRGMGGHATLNGDPSMSVCWTTNKISLRGLQWILLCTDGLLPPHLTAPSQHTQLAKGIALAYETAGVYAISEWRDAVVANHENKTKSSDMPHIEGYPEGSVIAIKFSN